MTGSARALQALILSERLHAVGSAFDRCRSLRYQQLLQQQRRRRALPEALVRAVVEPSNTPYILALHQQQLLLQQRRRRALPEALVRVFQRALAVCCSTETAFPACMVHFLRSCAA